MTPPGGDPRTIPTVSIPDIRDYERINAALVQFLDEGHARVRLQGAEGQRLLAAGLSGTWNAVVEIEGRAGPEVAAGLNAPGLTVRCDGAVADGAGRSLRAGRLVILGDAGPALGYAMDGGTVVVVGNAGPRAGLNQRGGVIAVLGAVGRLAGERQSSGVFFARGATVGPHSGLGVRGGRFVRLGPEGDELAGVGHEEAEIYRALSDPRNGLILPSA